MKSALTWAKTLLWAFALYWITSTAFGALVREVKAHNRDMLEIALEAKEEARWLYLRDCVRKNSVKSCEAAQ